MVSSEGLLGRAESALMLTSEEKSSWTRIEPGSADDEYITLTTRLSRFCLSVYLSVQLLMRFSFYLSGFVCVCICLRSY